MIQGDAIFGGDVVLAKLDPVLAAGRAFLLQQHHSLCLTLSAPRNPAEVHATRHGNAPVIRPIPDDAGGAGRAPGINQCSYEPTHRVVYAQGHS